MSVITEEFHTWTYLGSWDEIQLSGPRVLSRVWRRNIVICLGNRSGGKFAVCRAGETSVRLESVHPPRRTDLRCPSDKYLHLSPTRFDPDLLRSDVRDPRKANERDGRGRWNIPRRSWSEFENVGEIDNIYIPVAIHAKIPGCNHRSCRARDGSNRSDISSRAGTEHQNARRRHTRDIPVGHVNFPFAIQGNTDHVFDHGVGTGNRAGRRPIPG